MALFSSTPRNVRVVDVNQSAETPNTQIKKQLEENFEFPSPVRDPECGVA